MNTIRNTRNYHKKEANFHSYYSEILSLYDMGLNVFPLPLGQKAGYPWKRLQYTRLNRSTLPRLFSAYSNAGILCGHSSNNLFVLDCESNASFQYHITKMQQRGIPVWAVQTARGGHLYLRSSEGEINSVALDKSGDMEVRGRNAYVLAPPSLHPSGVFYSWHRRDGDAIPVVHPSQIDWLKDVNGNRITLEYERQYAYTKSWLGYQHQPSSNLSNATKQYLTSGQLIPEGARNDSLFRATCDMSGNEYSYQDAFNLLHPIASASGLEDREISKTINSAFSSPREPSRYGNYQPAPETWRYAMYFAVKHPWSGRTLSTDRAVFIALIERARVAASESGLFRASIREIAELARMGTSTVMRSLKRLRGDDFSHTSDTSQILIRRISNDRMSGATLWAFPDAIIEAGKRYESVVQQHEIPAHFAAYATSLFNADASERGIVGKSAMYLYRYMTTHPKAMRPKTLAENSELTRNQVNYALKCLKNKGLVIREANGWRALDMTDPELDKFVKAPPKAAQRKARFQQEREIFVSNTLYRYKRNMEIAKYTAFERQYKAKQPDSGEPSYVDYVRWTVDRLNTALTSVEKGLIVEYCVLCEQIHQITDEKPDIENGRSGVPDSIHQEGFFPASNALSVPESIHEKYVKRRDKPG